MIGKLLSILGVIFIFVAWFHLPLVLELISSTYNQLLSLYQEYEPIVKETIRTYVYSD